MIAAAVLRVSAPAKVNLYLCVGARRPDGYHDVTTVLQALELHDTVTLTSDRSFSVSCTPDIGVAPEDDLAYRAARQMSERFGHRLDVSIAIDKRIPAAAGLGGASADAAAVICGLAALWGLAADDSGLAAAARALGTDVPFFLVGGAALYQGRGDVLVRRLPSLDSPIVVVRPAEPVSTAAAYEAFDTMPPVPAKSVRPLADALQMKDAVLAARRLENNMMRASETLAPATRDALDLLSADADVLGASMAGSGSAVFGICRGPEAAARLEARARHAGFWAQATHTVDHGCRTEMD